MKKNILKVIIASLIVFQLMFFNLSVNASSNTNNLKQIDIIVSSDPDEEYDFIGRIDVDMSKLDRDLEESNILDVWIEKSPRFFNENNLMNVKINFTIHGSVPEGYYGLEEFDDGILLIVHAKFGVIEQKLIHVFTVKYVRGEIERSFDHIEQVDVSGFVPANKLGLQGKTFCSFQMDNKLYDQEKSLTVYKNINLINKENKQNTPFMNLLINNLQKLSMIKLILKKLT
jgi:hypothetical protein